MTATLVVSTTIVTAIGIVAGVAVGLAAAPRLINGQGQANDIGWDIAAGLSPATIAFLLAAALAVTVAAALILAARAAPPVLRRGDGGRQAASHARHAQLGGLPKGLPSSHPPVTARRGRLTGHPTIPASGTDR